jgi:hypothetical protein
MTLENEIEGRNLPRETYEVVFEIAVAASSPEKAAAKVRDMLLDPGLPINCDVYAIKYCAEAEDWFPDRDSGWQARFDQGGVRPSKIVAWTTVKTAAE